MLLYFPFQSTPSQRGRPKKLVGDLDYSVISIHALAKRATQFSINGTVIIGNFNPRPRKEGDLGFEMSFLLPYFISIHALAKRATCACIIIKVNGSYFNPRPRKEGDYILLYIHNQKG